MPKLPAAVREKGLIFVSWMLICRMPFAVSSVVSLLENHSPTTFCLLEVFLFSKIRVSNNSNEGWAERRPQYQDQFSGLVPLFVSCSSQVLWIRIFILFFTTRALKQLISHITSKQKKAFYYISPLCILKAPVWPCWRADPCLILSHTPLSRTHVW